MEEVVKGVRYITVEDKETYKILDQKEKLLIKLKKMQAEINKIAEEGEKIGAKIQKLKDKAKPKMQKHVDDADLKQSLEYDCPNCKWEQVYQFITEDNLLKMEIVDLIDQEKQRILTNKEKQDAENSNPDEGDNPLPDDVEPAAASEKE